MRKLFVLLAVVIAVAAPAMAGQIVVDYTNPFFENGQLKAASWGVQWLNGPFIDNAGNTFGAIYEKKHPWGWNEVCNGEFFSVKWFAVDAGTNYTVSSDWYAKLPNVSGEFRAKVFTTDNVSFEYDRLAGIFNNLAPDAYQATNYGTAGASEFGGSFTTASEASLGYVCIAQKGWSYGTGANEYKDQWSSRLYGTVINTEDPVVPEPSSVLALGSGLMGLVGFVIRRRK